MKVRLTRTWFAPTDLVQKFPMVDPKTGDKKHMMTIGGTRYKPGVYDFPPSFKDILPKTGVEYLEEDYVAPTPAVVEQTLKDADVERAASDAAAKVTQKAVDDRMAKARAARKKKQEEKKASQE